MTNANEKKEPTKQDFNKMAMDEREAERYDPIALMLKERVILAFGEVNDQMAYNVIAQIKKLQFVDSSKPIEILINSPGGSVIAGEAIYDAIRTSPCLIKTVGVGQQMSMGSVLLAAGDERYMTENSTLMIHSIGGGGGGGKLEDQVISQNFMSRLFEDMKEIYIRHIGLNADFWDTICSRDTFLSPEQALKMGFIDGIVSTNPKKATAYEKSAKLYADFNSAKREKAVPTGPDAIAKIEKLLMHSSAEDSLASKLRPELVVALSQYPEFWTEEKKAIMAAKAAAAAASNDNAGVVVPEVKKVSKGGPAGPA